VIRFWAPWIRRNHSNPAAPGELRFYVVLNGQDTEVDGPDPVDYHGETLFPKSRTFIPAGIRDNPYFDGTGYLGQLQSLPEPLRSILLNGDFFIEEEPQINQVIPTGWIRQAQARWRGDDLRAQGPLTDVGLDPSRGGADTTVFSSRALDPVSGDNISLPPDEELVEDLAAPRWKRTTTGIVIESKDEIRKRIGRSPGRGDAVAISYLDISPGVLFR